MTPFDPLILYTSFAQNPDDAVKKWGDLYRNLHLDRYIPQSFHSCLQLSSKIMNSDRSTELRAQLASIFTDTTKKLGVWTESVKFNIENYIESGRSIEIGHQPKFLGGERFLLNKLACGGILAKYSRSTNLNQHNSVFLPFLFIADYDKVHKELTRTMIPVINSVTGRTLKIPKHIENHYNGTSIASLPLPSEKEFQEILENIRTTMKFSFQSAAENHFQRQLWEERMESAIQILQTTYHQTSSSFNEKFPYSEWFGRIIGVLINIIGDYGMVFVNANDSRLQRIFLPHYESILRDQDKYIKSYIHVLELLESYGFRSPFRPISRDFVPFFVSCDTLECNKHRIELHLRKTTVSSNVWEIFGTCEKCKQRIQLEFNPHHPDLSEWQNKLSPRVDSRQYLVSATIQPQIHIAGTGETRYYMHDLPLLQHFKNDLNLPIIYYYNKITLHTPWTRSLESQMKIIPSFHDTIKALMKSVGKYKKLTKKSEDKSLYKSRRQENLNLLYSINNYFNQLEKICDNASTNTEIPSFIRRNIIPVFSANFFGKVRKEKYGQTSVFHWIDLFINNGKNALFSDYEQIYRPWQVPGQNILL
ncbi:bacillithiol biosynthesis protein BshC [Candidatus Harpocratesius sp.]